MSRRRYCSVILTPYYAEYFFSVHSSQVFICEPEIWSLLVADGGQLLIKCLLGALSREGDNDNCPRMVL